MKRSKRMLVLLGVLAVISIGTVFLNQYEEKKEEIQNSEEVILAIEVDAIESISWQYEEEGLAFRKEDGWIYESDEAFPVSKTALEGILSCFEQVSASFRIENVEDYSQYGLDEPECTVLLHASEQDYELKLGAFSKMDEKRYIDMGDGNVYLLSEDPVDHLTTDLAELILHDEIPEFDRVTEIQYAGDEGYTAFYQEENDFTYSDEDVYFVEKEGENLPLDCDKVEAYLDEIAYLNLSTYATYNATEEELQSFGLSEPELSVTIQYSYQDEDETEVTDALTLHISKNPEEQKAYEEASKNGDEELPEVTKYVRLGDSPIVYELEEEAYEVLAAASYDDLRHREVTWVDFDMVTKMEISLEGETHTLLSEEDEDAGRLWYYEEEEIEISTIKNAVEALTAYRFTEQETDQKEEIRVTFYLENEHFPQITVQLYRHDGEHCLAMVDGETVSLVSRSKVVDLIEAVQAIVLE